MLAFDEPTHAYLWNGKPVPSVTQALEGITDYRFVNPDALERARQEGQAIHAMVELHLKNDLDESELPQWLEPRFAALKKLIAETQFTLRASEKQVYNTKYGYAGTLDICASLVVGSKPKQVEAVIDVKRSFAAGPTIGLQLAAYQDAENLERFNAGTLKAVTHRYALNLRDDGSYRLEPFTSENDFTTFLAFLTTKKWKDHHGHR